MAKDPERRQAKKADTKADNALPNIVNSKNSSPYKKKESIQHRGTPLAKVSQFSPSLGPRTCRKPLMS